jgi:hypothetical protein
LTCEAGGDGLGEADDGIVVDDGAAEKVEREGGDGGSSREELEWEVDKHFEEHSNGELIGRLPARCLSTCWVALMGFLCKRSDCASLTACPVIDRFLPFAWLLPLWKFHDA